MPKRKSVDECIDDCKRFRDEQFPIDNSRSDHEKNHLVDICLLYTSPSPRDQRGSRMPSSA